MRLGIPGLAVLSLAPLQITSLTRSEVEIGAQSVERSIRAQHTAVHNDPRFHGAATSAETETNKTPRLEFETETETSWLQFGLGLCRYIPAAEAETETPWLQPGLRQRLGTGAAARFETETDTPWLLPYLGGIFSFMHKTPGSVHLTIREDLLDVSQTLSHTNRSL